MAQTSQKLDQLKAMIAELQKAQSSNSDPQAKALVDGIPLIFKQHMDNNLDVKAAFDALYGIVSTLFLLSKKGKLSRVDADAAVACLRRVDSVLQVLF
jgi:cysteinyl-tRNA synthetase